MTQKNYKDLPVDWPLDVNKIRGGVENNTFGMVRRRADGTKKPHQGWDFTTEDGDQVYSVADGVVVAVSNGGDYGVQLIIKHTLPNDGIIFSFYAHLLSIGVKVGDKVKLGQSICKAGSSGNASKLPSADKHLHFEFRTEQHCGLGLKGRFSPFEVFGTPPYKVAVKRQWLCE